MPPSERIHYLLQQYHQGKCAAAELRELDDWYEALAVNGYEQGLWPQDGNGTAQLVEEQYRSLQAYLQEHGDLKPVRRISFGKRAAMAAAIVFCLVGTAYYFLWQKNNPTTLSAAVQDVQPGGNHATLTLANGQTIRLDSAANGQLAAQGNTKIIKLNNGQLAYRAKGNATAASYNTLSTPRGGQYRITLPDGTDVWLNAASSIRFPTAFTGARRTVEITGEAYFEVVHNAAKPFQVQVGSMQVEVLGTHFNVNAYRDESSIRTTLLQGSVAVTQSGHTRKIIPGTQAIVAGNDIKIQSADIEQAVAWKNGLFDFDGTELEEVMRQLSRWYDVDVVYSSRPPQRHFAGEIGRDLNLSQVLRGLEMMNVHFTLKGKQLIIKE